METEEEEVEEDLVTVEDLVDEEASEEAEVRTE